MDEVKGYCLTCVVWEGVVVYYCRRGVTVGAVYISGYCMWCCPYRNKRY